MVAVAPAIGSAIGRVRRAPRAVDLPDARLLDLPGRGQTCLYDCPGPPGAPTVLLLHALGTTAALCWYPSVPALSEHFRVVTFDQRWHGRGVRSERFRLDDCADDAAAVAQALGIDQAIVVGYSMGGAVAQLVWRRHRELVSGLVLAATARNFRGKLTERLWFTATELAMSRFGAGVQARADRLANGLERQPPRMRASDPVVAPWAMREFRSTSAWAMFAALDEMGRFDSSAWVRRIDVPTSVVVAERDRLIPTRRQRRLAASIPGAVTFDVPGSHAAVVLGAAEFVPTLVAACGSVAKRVRRAGAPA